MASPGSRKSLHASSMPCLAPLQTRMLSASTPPDERLRVRDVRPRRIGLGRQRDELLEVPRCLLTVAGGFGSAGGARQTTITIRVFLQRALELPERRRGIPTLEQELPEHLAHWIEPVLHR